LSSSDYRDSAVSNGTTYYYAVTALDTAGNESARSSEVSVTLSAYDLWAGSWQADIGAETNDFDSDGFSNISEYALAGNPTNALDQGTQPVLSSSGNGFIYVHPQRADDTGIIYRVEISTNLISGVWTNEGCIVIGTNVTGGTIDFVTNDVGVIDKDTFFRLTVEQ
jgi:hypothetical protein